MEKQLKPAIRFKGFTDPWEQRKVGDITIESTEYLTLDSGLPLFTSSRNGLMYQNEYRGNVTTDSKQTLFSVVPLGACTYRHMSDDDVFHLNINTIEKGLVSREYPVFCGTQNHDIVFIVQYINSSKAFRAFCAEQKMGGTRTRLYYKALCEFTMMVPRFAEQRRISKFLLTFDHLITLHQRKYDKLQVIKKAMLEKMFPPNGSNVPEIRFRGFTDPWEQRKFDEVFDCTVPNNTLSRAELSYDEGTVLNVHYGDVLIKYGSVLDVQKDDIPRIPYRCREDFNGALLQDGDVIIADTAEDETTGKACEIGNLQGRAIVSGLHTMVCRPRHRMALGYLGHYLNSNAYHHQLLPLMQGIKVLSLSRSNIQKTSVSYPTVEKEQQLIANYFSQLDNLITLHQRELEKLQKIKKAMLEKMFV